MSRNKIHPAQTLNLCEMDSKDDAHNRKILEGTGMWCYNEFEIFEMYEKGNGNPRQDAEDCLKLYAHKFKWPLGAKSKVLDIGSGDGSVTKIITKYIPKGCELTGADINEKVLKYATMKYANERLKFIPFDVLGEVPENMKGRYDHVFAMYLFHWVRDHEKAFTNIYNILPKGGEFFSIFLGINDAFTIFEILAKRNKWSQWMQENIALYTPPYHDFQDPDLYVTKILNKVGFNILDVRCKQRVYVHDNIEEFRGLITAINGFDIPKHMWPEFLDDFMDVKRFMNLMDDIKGTVKTNYNIIVVHCTK